MLTRGIMIQIAMVLVRKEENQISCEVPDGYADNTSDCDDTNTIFNPDAPEICDGLDNDCDGECR